MLPAGAIAPADQAGLATLLAQFSSALATLQAQNLELVTALKSTKSTAAPGGGKSDTTRAATDYNLFYQRVVELVKSDAEIGAMFQAKYPAVPNKKGDSMIAPSGATMKFASELWDKGNSTLAKAFLEDAGGHLSRLRAAAGTTTPVTTASSNSSSSNSSSSSSSASTASTSSTSSSTRTENAKITNLHKLLTGRGLTFPAGATLAELQAIRDNYDAEKKAEAKAAADKAMADKKAATAARNADAKTAKADAAAAKKEAAAKAKAEKELAELMSWLSARNLSYMGLDLEGMKALREANKRTRPVKPELRKIPAATVIAVPVTKHAMHLPTPPSNSSSSNSSSSNSAAAVVEPEVEWVTMNINGQNYLVDPETLRAYAIVNGVRSEKSAGLVEQDESEELYLVPEKEGGEEE
jgi:hypothetical protein